MPPVTDGEHNSCIKCGSYASGGDGNESIHSREFDPTEVLISEKTLDFLYALPDEKVVNPPSVHLTSKFSAGSSANSPLYI